MRQTNSHNLASRLILLAALSALSAGAAQAAGDPTQGLQVFQSQCAACHSVSPGVTLFGPSLATVYGHPAGGTKGYPYSQALLNAHLVWDAPTLDKFIASPQTDVPGTRMPFPGLSDPAQRQDLIAYLAQVAQNNASK